MPVKDNPRFKNRWATSIMYFVVKIELDVGSQKLSLTTTTMKIGVVVPSQKIFWIRLPSLCFALLLQQKPPMSAERSKFSWESQNGVLALLCDVHWRYCKILIGRTLKKLSTSFLNGKFDLSCAKLWGDDWEECSAEKITNDGIKTAKAGKQQKPSNHLE